MSPTCDDFYAVQERLEQYAEWLMEHDLALWAGSKTSFNLDKGHLKCIDISEGLQFIWEDWNDSVLKFRASPEEVFCEDALEKILERKNRYFQEQVDLAARRVEKLAQLEAEKARLTEAAERETLALLTAKYKDRT